LLIQKTREGGFVLRDEFITPSAKKFISKFLLSFLGEQERTFFETIQEREFVCCFFSLSAVIFFCELCSFFACAKNEPKKDTPDEKTLIIHHVYNDHLTIISDRSDLIFSSES
jgi:hypothetical protein